MPHAKSVAALGAAAVILCGCGAVVKPPQGRGRVEDPRTTYGRLECLRAHRLPVAKVGRTVLQIGALPAGPTVQFEPSDGAAETRQVEGSAQGAEVIGSALVYPHQAPGAELTQIENCVGQGMNG
jgi:hypothetical protein